MHTYSNKTNTNSFFFTIDLLLVYYKFINYLQHIHYLSTIYIYLLPDVYIFITEVHSSLGSL